MVARLCIAGLLGLFLSVGSARAYDVNKDLKNIGNVAAHDLTVKLSGTETVTNHYDGYPDRRFTSFSHGPTPPNTELRWQDLVEPGGNGMIDPGEIVHVGWTTADHSSNIKDMWWTDATGGRIPGSKIFNMTSGWRYESGVVTLNWFNDFLPEGGDPETMSVIDLHYAILDQAVPLDQLNLANGELNDQLVLLDSFFDVFYQQPVDMTVPQPVNPNQAVVLRYEVAAPGSSAEAVDFVQFVVPEPSSMLGVGLGSLLVMVRHLRRGGI